MTALAPTMSASPTLTRRRVLGGAAVLGLGAVATLTERRVRGRRVVPLGQAGLALGAAGAVVELGPDDLLLPGTRVLADADRAEERAGRQLKWLATGSVPGGAALGASTMTRDALLDLHVLMTGSPAPVAAWSPPWRYVWARDSAFAAVALARTGHRNEAAGILTHLQAIQSPDGTFQARYVAGTGRVPDARGVQLDGTGFALWALAEVAATLTVGARTRLLAATGPLLERSTALLSRLATGERLPTSSDYWERPERRPTLAVSAMVLSGLESAAALHRLVGADATADRVADQADAFGRRVVSAFGPTFPRRLGGPASSRDLGIAFLLPPFQSVADPRVASAWAAALRTMRRPAGGLAPGGSWPNDGVSWTPTTATAAMTAAAAGDRAGALGWLRWLDDHRTSQGALPEKVLADGRPAEVAPLTWTAAAVIIGADQLDRG